MCINAVFTAAVVAIHRGRFPHASPTRLPCSLPPDLLLRPALPGPDIFDGWGSYPPYLQSSTVFKGIFDLANTWYSVFQQHCS